MAERVVQAPQGQGPVSGADAVGSVQRQAEDREEEPVQRKCSNCEKEEKERVQRQEKEPEEEPVQRQPEKEEDKPPVQMMPLMRKSAGGGYTATPALSSRLSASTGGGSVLPAPTRAHMESAFGADFSRVRIHADRDAAEMNAGINARAFTYGSDIYFNSGQYAPESGEGQRLLAHELTHVVQQGGGGRPLVQRYIGDGHDLTSPRFALDPMLEACYDGELKLNKQSRGEAVKKIQQALIDLNYNLGPTGADGIYGNFTWNAVKKFKKDHRLGWEQMGDVGPLTMSRLNDIFPGPPLPCPPDVLNNINIYSINDTGKRKKNLSCEIPQNKTCKYICEPDTPPYKSPQIFQNYQFCTCNFIQEYFNQGEGFCLLIGPRMRFYTNKNFNEPAAWTYQGTANYYETFPEGAEPGEINWSFGFAQMAGQVYWTAEYNNGGIKTTHAPASWDAAKNSQEPWKRVDEFNPKDFKVRESVLTGDKPFSVFALWDNEKNTPTGACGQIKKAHTEANYVIWLIAQNNSNKDQRVFLNYINIYQNKSWENLEPEKDPTNVTPPKWRSSGFQEIVEKGEGQGGVAVLSGKKTNDYLKDNMQYSRGTECQKTR